MEGTPATVTTTLEDILITRDLWHRPARPPDFACETEALHRFAQLLADDPDMILQQLLALALDCCAADSAGVSLLEQAPDGTEVIRCVAAAGPLAVLKGTVAARNASACGVCLDLSAPQLFDLPARHFTDIAPSGTPEIYETLMVELGQPDDASFGVVWIVAHTLSRQFDAEDARLLSRLSRFTAAALRMQQPHGLAPHSGDAQDRLLIKITHDLRQPLQSILGWVQMLRASSLVPEKIPMAYEAIDRNARAQERLLSDLLDLSRVRAGTLHVELRPVDLCAVVDDVVSSFHPVSLSHQVTVDCTVDRPLRLVLADDQRLRQIVSNLLLNALKFTPQGGDVFITVRNKDDHVEMIVRDTGVGIDPEFVDKVFQPFHQGPQVVSGRSRGVGIGLTIVRELVEACGGTITVHSDGVGQGTTMTVRLLIVPDAPAAS